MKKWITLSERADVAGEIRFPEEGAIAVSTADANRLIDAGKAKVAEPPEGAAPAKKPTRRRAARKTPSPAPTPTPSPAPMPTPSPSTSPSSAE